MSRTAWVLLEQYGDNTLSEYACATKKIAEFMAVAIDPDDKTITYTIRPKGMTDAQFLETIGSWSALERADRRRQLYAEFGRADHSA